MRSGWSAAALGAAALAGLIASGAGPRGGVTALASSTGEGLLAVRAPLALASLGPWLQIGARAPAGGPAGAAAAQRSFGRQQTFGQRGASLFEQRGIGAATDVSTLGQSSFERAIAFQRRLALETAQGVVPGIGGAPDIQAGIGSTPFQTGLGFQSGLGLAGFQTRTGLQSGVGVSGFQTGLGFQTGIGVTGFQTGLGFQIGLGQVGIQSGLQPSTFLGSLGRSEAQIRFGVRSGLGFLSGVGPPGAAFGLAGQLGRSGAGFRSALGRTGFQTGFGAPGVFGRTGFQTGFGAPGAFGRAVPGGAVGRTDLLGGGAAGFRGGPPQQRISADAAGGPTPFGRAAR